MKMEVNDLVEQNLRESDAYHEAMQQAQLPRYSQSAPLRQETEQEIEHAQYGNNHDSVKFE
jgi:hypothetical protein